MRFMTRLKSATSPYLLQHADNPVDWWPWSPEAFAEARRRDVPILLSVGYAACHWCHVMAHESFEDTEVAAAMNERFVNIKVDRDDRARWLADDVLPHARGTPIFRRDVFSARTLSATRAARCGRVARSARGC